MYAFKNVVSMYNFNNIGIMIIIVLFFYSASSILIATLYIYRLQFLIKLIEK